MTIDRELVTRKLLLVATDLESLAPIYAKGLHAYLTDTIDQSVVERRLERTVSRMIDINYHLITSVGQPPPADYHSSFLKLADSGVCDVEFARRIARAGLRNRLVHDYEDLDPHKVFEALGDALRDVPHYLERVNAYVKRDAEAPAVEERHEIALPGRRRSIGSTSATWRRHVRARASARFRTTFDDSGTDRTSLTSRSEL